MTEVFNIDNMVGMAKYPDKYFDLAIVDPPYGISINMNMGRQKGKAKRHKDESWDDAPPDESYFKELFRVSNNQIIWGGNYFPLPLTKSWIFWDKLVPEGVSFADGELAWTSFDMTLRKLTVLYSGFQGTEGKIHPTQKPVKLYKWLLKEYAKAGDKILDTHLGSGSSRIACEDMGFDLVAFENNKDYYDSQEQRFNEYKSQLKLFQL